MHARTSWSAAHEREAPSSLRASALGRAVWILRAASALVFAGHGALAISVNPAWLPFFAVVGLSEDAGRALMPLIGMLDISLAVLILVRPIPAALAWMTLWAFWTALLRPLAGQSVLDFVERGANWGAPLALLLMLGVPRSPRAWFRAFPSGRAQPVISLRESANSLGDLVANPSHFRDRP